MSDTVVQITLQTPSDALGAAELTVAVLKSIKAIPVFADATIEIVPPKKPRAKRTTRTPASPDAAPAADDEDSSLDRPLANPARASAVAAE